MVQILWAHEKIVSLVRRRSVVLWSAEKRNKYTCRCWLLWPRPFPSSANIPTCPRWRLFRVRSPSLWL